MDDEFDVATELQPDTKSWSHRMQNCLDEDLEGQVKVGAPTGVFSFRRLFAYVGPGFLVAIAYIDPGNFDTDIRAGAMYQYKLLWMLALATVMGLFVQFLACKLGLIAQKDLAQQCRESYPKKMNIFLWIMAEVGVIASDIPEVLGTAYALNLLFGIPLVWGVVITALDTLAFLMLQYASIRILESIIGIFLMIVSGCFIIELFWAGFSVVDVLEGFIPFYGITEGQGSFGGYGAAAIGLLGAVVMPHNLFLHSALVKTRKIERSTLGIKEAMIYNVIECGLALFVSFIINFSIIAISSSLFYYNPDAGLNEAANLLTVLGSSAGIIFGIALLASGQSSTITGTYAGQFVMEGFLNLSISMWKRNLVTRSVAIVPSLVVAAVWGSSGADNLIVWSQVLLSIQLPFALVPLLKMTGSAKIMGTNYANGKALQISGWLIGILIIVANVVLVGFSVLDYLDLNRWRGWIVLAFEIDIGIFYVILLAYLSYFAVDSNSKPPVIDQEVYHEEMVEFLEDDEDLFSLPDEDDEQLDDEVFGDD